MIRNSLLVLTAALLLLPTAGTAQKKRRRPLTGPELERRIAKAAPGYTQVKPAKARRVLIFSATQGFYHRVIPVAKKALRILGEKSGAYLPVVSDDLANFEPARLAEFDAVIFNNTTGRVFHTPRMVNAGGQQPQKAADVLKQRQGIVKTLKGLTAKEGQKPTEAEEKLLGQIFRGRQPAPLTKADIARIQQVIGQLQMQVDQLQSMVATDPREAMLLKSLLDYVKKGGGFVGIHAATDTYLKQPLYLDLVGGAFDGHPWTANRTVSVVNLLPEHPLNAGFKGKGFHVKDEIYQFKAPYDRSKLNVLLALEIVDGKERLTGIKGKRADNDYAISWYKPYGKGRVFYCSLGHNREIFWNRPILRHYLAGIQYACGDLELKAPAAPKPKEEGK